MEEALTELRDHILAQIEELILDTRLEYGELTLFVPPHNIIKTIKFLRDDPACRFTTLIDISGVDYPERIEARFDVAYHLLSMYQNQRIRVSLMVGEETAVPSLTDLFPAANWFEREVFDLYGVFFSDHPDLRRILTDYGFNGHPLRKDFPLTGFVELRYDENQKRVVYEPVRLVQEMRSFDFMSPWEGTDYVLPGDEKAEAAKEGGQ